MEAVFFLKRHLFQLAPTLLDLIPGSCLRVGRLESPSRRTRSRSSNRFEWVKFEWECLLLREKNFHQLHEQVEGQNPHYIVLLFFFFLAREFSHYVTVAASYSARDFFSVALLLHFTSKWWGVLCRSPYLHHLFYTFCFFFYLICTRQPLKAFRFPPQLTSCCSAKHVLFLFLKKYTD